MSKERYEIRGRLGQGGLGTVYRAWDRNLKREVAIKRIRIKEEDEYSEKEATRQMERETGALATLQHPNIVTVYDYGSDEDGPFVVMELIGGATIDDVIANHALTLQDFMEFVSQVQEGLIAAQDLGLVHRDLKPANLMLNWLPSGRFQVKIVDFGLAKFSPKPSQQTLDHRDSLYGSIYCMAPEQFERGELDASTDMYSIGAVYYYTLAGDMPFDGDTGPQVMAAHLDHRVIPLIDKRPDLPQWLSDWVMWHINRYPQERPQDAREALASFLELKSSDPYGASAASSHTYGSPLMAPEKPGREAAPTQSPETQAEPAPEPALEPSPQPGTEPTPTDEPPKRPRLMIPGVEPSAPGETSSTPAATQTDTSSQTTAQPEPTTSSQPPQTGTSPQPLQPPPGSKPSLHTTSHQTASAAPETAPDAPDPAPSTPGPEAAATDSPQNRPRLVVPGAAATQPDSPTSPPAEQPSTPSASPAPTSQTPTSPGHQTGSPASPITTPTQPVATSAAATSPAGTQPASETSNALPTPPKKRLSNGAKIAIAGILSVVVIVLVVILINLSSDRKRTERYNTLLNEAKEAAETESPEIQINARDLGILLESVNIGSNEDRGSIYFALAIAKSKDGTNIGNEIANYAINQVKNNDVRKGLFDKVLRYRTEESLIPTLLDFVRATDDYGSATMALKIVAKLGSDEQIDDYLEILKSTSSISVRSAAEDAIEMALKDSKRKSQFFDDFVSLKNKDNKLDVRLSAIRLIGNLGGKKAEQVISATLKSSDQQESIAAMKALEKWPSLFGFENLHDYYLTIEDPGTQRRVFNSAIQALKNHTHEESGIDTASSWAKLAEIALEPAQQHAVINALGQRGKAGWAKPILQGFTKEGYSARVITLAEKAIDHLESKEEPTDE